MKTNDKITAYILRGSTGALLFSCVIVALCLTINNTGGGRYHASGEGPTPTPTCAPPPPNMVSWWPGDGNTDDIVDGNDGTFIGPSYVTGEVGQAFSFNGTNYVQVPDAANLDFPNSSPISIDMWVYRTGNGSVMHFIGKRFECGTTNYQMSLNTDTGDGLVFGGSSGGVATGQDLPLNTWTHLAGTFDGSTFRFYINGDLAGMAAGVAIGPTNNQPLRIGTSGLCENFVGLIDEVELFNRALSQAEVQAIYNAGSAGKCRPTPTPTCAPPPSNLLSWWPGDGNAYDIVDGNTGTLEGGTTFATGEVGQAFSFDGVDDFVRIPASPSLQPAAITLDAWINPPQFVAGYQKLITKDFRGDGTWDPPYASYILDLVNMVPFVSITINGTLVGCSSLDPVPVGSFTHVAGTYDGAAIRIYQNGVLKNTTSAVGTITYGNLTDLALGMRSPYAPGEYFAGLLDEADIYDRALSQAEVQAIYNAGSAGKCKCVTPPPNMVSWWPGDGNTDDIIDGNSGTFVGPATYATGEVGQAFSFNGSNYVQVPDAANLDFEGAAPITIDMWVYRVSSAPVTHFIGKREGCGLINYQMALDFQGLSFGGHGGGVVTGRDLPLNTWTHLAGTFDGSTVRFYINGELAGEAAATSMGPTNNAPLRIGTSGDCERFGGLIDEVELFNRALSQSEIQAIVNAGSAGKCRSQGSPSPTPTATVTPTATATATSTATATATPCTRCSPTPRPRPTPAPRP